MMKIDDLMVIASNPKKLKPVGKGWFSKVYEHPTDPQSVIIHSNDLMKDCLNMYNNCYKKSIHVPRIEHLTENDDLGFTVYVSQRYNKLTKRDYPKAYTDFKKIVEVFDIFGGSVRKSLDKNNNFETLENHENSTLLYDFVELAELSLNYSEHVKLDLKKSNFMVDDSGNLIFNDIFHLPKQYDNKDLKSW